MNAKSFSRILLCFPLLLSSCGIRSNLAGDSTKSFSSEDSGEVAIIANGGKGQMPGLGRNGRAGSIVVPVNLDQIPFI